MARVEGGGGIDPVPGMALGWLAVAMLDGWHYSAGLVKAMSV
jgi:hypothetical protein